MPFGHDTEDGLLSVAALVNTATPDDTLTEIADLDAFVESWGYTGTHERTHAELDEVRALRPRFLEAWSLSRDELVAFVNENGQRAPWITVKNLFTIEEIVTMAEVPQA